MISRKRGIQKLLVACVALLAVSATAMAEHVTSDKTVSGTLKKFESVYIYNGAEVTVTATGDLWYTAHSYVGSSSPYSA